MRWLFRLLLVLFLLVVIAATVVSSWVLTHRDQARAWRRSAVIAGSLADIPVASRATGLLAADVTSPRVTSAGALPATVVSPDDGARTHPAIIVLVPGGTSDVQLARVHELQVAIARAGLAAWAVRAPRIADAFEGDAAPDAIAGAIVAVATDASTRGGQASILATGSAATLVLAAAGIEPARSHVRAIVAVSPIGDLQAFARYAVTGSTRDAAGVEHVGPIDAELRTEATRALIDAVRADLPSEASIAARVLEAVADADDPIATLAALPLARVSPLLATTSRLASATTASAFDDAWSDLPASVRSAVAERSPINVADQVEARVLIVTSPDPRHWASIEARRLDAELEDARVHAVRGLGDADAIALDLEDSSQTGELRDLLGVSAWWLLRAGA